MIKQATMKISHFKSEMASKQKQLGSNSEEFTKDNEMLKRTETEINSLEVSTIHSINSFSKQFKPLYFLPKNTLKKMNYSEERMQELQTNRRELMKEHTSLQEYVDNFTARRPYSQFNYSNPTPNFDRRRVYGVVCRLIKLKDQKTATALQEVAGGRVRRRISDFIKV